MPDLSIGSPFAFIDSYELGLWPYEPPTPIYKYMEKKWAQKFLDTGELQISPISTYRDLQTQGETRDEEDGKQRPNMCDADLPIEHPFAFSDWETYSTGTIVNPKTIAMYYAHDFQMGSSVNERLR